MSKTHAFILLEMTLDLPHAWVETYPSCVAVSTTLRQVGLLPPEAEQVIWQACPHGRERTCRVSYQQRQRVPVFGEDLGA